MSGQFVTPREIADAYNDAAREAGAEEIDVRTVRREIARGNLHATRIGRLWLVTETDAQEWLKSYERYRRK